MERHELIRFIRQLVRQELAPIMMGTLTQNASQTRSSAQRFSSENAVENMRSIQPFGVSSRAPKGTPCLMIPNAHDPSHINMAGHFDEDRPTGNDGETLLYDAYGHVVYMSQSKIQVGSKAAAENFVLGQVFKQFADDLLEKIAAHTHIGNLGYETTPPENAAEFTALKASPIDDDAILSDKIFGEK